MKQLTVVRAIVITGLLFAVPICADLVGDSAPEEVAGMNLNGTYPGPVMFEGSSGTGAVGAPDDWYWKAPYCVFRSGLWIYDNNRDGVYDERISTFGMAGDIPVGDSWYLHALMGERDWHDLVLWRPSSREFIVDAGGDGDVNFRKQFGLATDKPIIGDWGTSYVRSFGVFRAGQFILDFDRDGVADQRINFGMAGDIPVIGDWDGDGDDNIGVFRSGQFILDYNNDGTVDLRRSFGLATDVPVIGDWDRDNDDNIGVYRSGQFIVDYDNNGVADDRKFFGMASDKPVQRPWYGARRYRAVEDSVISYANYERRTYGGINRGDLAYHSTLAGVARAHSNDMEARDYFDHYTLGTGESPGDRMVAAGLSPLDWAAENIACGYPDNADPWYVGKSIVYNFVYDDADSGWGHRDNILDTRNSLTGVGAAYGNLLHDGTWYTGWIVTEDFCDL